MDLMLSMSVFQCFLATSSSPTAPALPACVSVPSNQDEMLAASEVSTGADGIKRRDSRSKAFWALVSLSRSLDVTAVL